METVQSVVNPADEIDLFDLVDDIKDKWYWLAGTVVSALLLAVAYALLATPVFQTEVVLKQVSDADLLQLNQPRLREVFGVAADKDLVTPEKAFKEVRAKALSVSSMRGFYEKLLESDNQDLKAMIFNPQITHEQNFARFTGRFSHSDPVSKDTDLFLGVKLDLENAQLASDVLNEYIQFVCDQFKTKKTEEIGLQLNAKLDLWRLDAEQKRSQYFAQKQRTLFDLNEAAQVAASIKQQQPLYSGERVAVGSTPPLYMMGEKALRAQIQQLENRSAGNEDAYINGLPELLWKIDAVEKTAIQWAEVRFVDVDQKAIVPLKPIKPKKKLVVALGAVGGLFAGILFALLAAAQSRRRERKAALVAH
ncbi:Wzz/FepE/Etk N-terminal domain-containing protein [Thalassolituus sp. LLYu03]|uniref:Wzz/FepE/Etk N-terminal domain-containing protein n=1 Tax=Thalassolituus sp. LLYu03 TaxID=3421656 RepID=UPI003D283950